MINFIEFLKLIYLWINKLSKNAFINPFWILLNLSNPQIVKYFNYVSNLPILYILFAFFQVEISTFTLFFE